MILGLFKNVNYQANNAENYKSNSVSEFYGALDLNLN